MQSLHANIGWMEMAIRLFMSAVVWIVINVSEMI